MTMTDVLARETAHLPQTDRDRIERRLMGARFMVAFTPRATEQALTTKLQSYGDCPRWVCVLIARAALGPRPAVTTAPLAIAIQMVLHLPERHLRSLESDLCVRAFNEHYDPDTDAMTDEGLALRDRAEAIDLFLFQRSGRVAAPTTQ